MIVIGFFAGLLARALKPGDDSLGFIFTTILGILGSLFAGLAGRAMGFYNQGEGASFLAAVVGAVVLLYLAQLYNGKKS